MTPLDEQLAALAHPAPPPDLAAVVLARIERIEMSAEPAPVASRDWSAWGIVGGGVAAGLAVYATDALAFLEVPASAENAVILGAGLVLFAAGLFAPLGLGSASAASGLRGGEAP